MNGKARALRGMIASAGVTLKQVADASGRSLPYVSMQAAGKREVTDDVVRAALDLFNERQDRRDLLLNAAQVLRALPGTGVLLDGKDTVLAAAELIEELAEEQVARRKGMHHFKLAEAP